MPGRAAPANRPGGPAADRLERHDGRRARPPACRWPAPGRSPREGKRGITGDGLAAASRPSIMSPPSSTVRAWAGNAGVSRTRDAPAPSSAPATSAARAAERRVDLLVEPPRSAGGQARQAGASPGARLVGIGAPVSVSSTRTSTAGTGRPGSPEVDHGQKAAGGEASPGVTRAGEVVRLHRRQHGASR